MKRFLTVAITTIMIASGSVQALANVPAEWAMQSVQTVQTRGLVPEETFRRSYGGQATRAEMVISMLRVCREFVEIPDATVQLFLDTDNLELNTAATYGLVSGVDAHHFDPEGFLTREQAATMLARVILTLVDKEHKECPVIEDRDTISDWAQDNVCFIVEQGLMSGVGDGRFNPKGSLTREQMIVLVDNLFNYLGALHEQEGLEEEAVGEFFEREVFRLTNEEREKVGLPPFKWDEDLAKAARNHNKDMGENDLYSHTGSDGSSPRERINRETDRFNRGWAENIYMGPKTPEAAVEGWMESTGHKANILSEQMEYLGVGFYDHFGVYFWTQKFATTSNY